jgi:hypothetical protein
MSRLSVFLANSLYHRNVEVVCTRHVGCVTADERYRSTAECTVHACVVAGSHNETGSRQPCANIPVGKRMTTARETTHNTTQHSTDIGSTQYESLPRAAQTGQQKCQFQLLYLYGHEKKEEIYQSARGFVDQSARG